MKIDLDRDIVDGWRHVTFIRTVSVSAKDCPTFGRRYRAYNATGTQLFGMQDFASINGIETALRSTRL